MTAAPECRYQSDGLEQGQPLAQRVTPLLDDVAQTLDVDLLLPDELGHLGGAVVGVLVDDAQRADDRPTAEAEVAAALGRVLLAVQRLGEARRRPARSVLAAYRLQRPVTVSPRGGGP